MTAQARPTAARRRTPTASSNCGSRDDGYGATGTSGSLGCRRGGRHRDDRQPGCRQAAHGRMPRAPRLTQPAAPKSRAAGAAAAAQHDRAPDRAGSPPSRRPGESTLSCVRGAGSSLAQSPTYSGGAGPIRNGARFAASGSAPRTIRSVRDPLMASSCRRASRRRWSTCSPSSSHRPRSQGMEPVRVRRDIGSVIGGHEAGEQLDRAEADRLGASSVPGSPPSGALSANAGAKRSAGPSSHQDLVGPETIGRRRLVDARSWAGSSTGRCTRTNASAVPSDIDTIDGGEAVHRLSLGDEPER